jgi:hypothetical protein
LRIFALRLMEQECPAKGLEYPEIYLVRDWPAHLFRTGGTNASSRFVEAQAALFEWEAQILEQSANLFLRIGNHFFVDHPMDPSRQYAIEMRHRTESGPVIRKSKELQNLPIFRCSRKRFSKAPENRTVHIRQYLRKWILPICTALVSDISRARKTAGR